MIAVVEFDLATGHTEVLDRLRTNAEALRVADMLDDHSTDHVVYTRDEGDQ